MVIGIVRKNIQTKLVREISMVVDYVAEAFFTMETPNPLYNIEEMQAITVSTIYIG